MRRLLVRILGTALSFYIASAALSGFRLEPTWSAYLVASLIFVLFNWIAHPLVKLLLLPINLLTLGLFRWLSNVIVLYVFDLMYDGISITPSVFGGFSTGLVSLPPMQLSLFWTFVVASLLMSVTYSLFSLILTSDSE